LSTAQLSRLVAQSRPMPTEMSREDRFGDLIADTREVLDTIAAAREGHDVSQRRLREATYKVRYWGEMAQILAPFVGMNFDAEVVR
jgi:hypothetical protein